MSKKTEARPKRTRLMGPLPYYKWLVLDYRASRNANALGYIARGLYRVLLDECWLEGHIPDDLAKLATICRCPLSVMHRHWPTLRPLFIAVDGLDGMLLQNAKMELQRTELDALRVKRAVAGGSSKREQMLTKSPSSSSSMSKSSSTDAEAFAPPAAALPTPHGAARLADGLDVLIAKAQRGELTRGGVPEC